MRRGEATCSICHHKWQAMYPEDVFMNLECPECHHMTGETGERDEEEFS